MRAQRSVFNVEKELSIAALSKISYTGQTSMTNNAFSASIPVRTNAMTFFKTLVIVATTLAAMYTLDVQADTLDDVRSKGTLRVAVPQDSPPFGSVGVNMQLQGYDVDLANMLAKDLGVSLQLVPVSSATRIPYIQTGKVDVIISSLGKSPDREKAIDFSMPYAIVFSGVFGPASVPVSKPEDLAGRMIGASRGSLEDLEITKLAPTADIRRFEDAAATMQALLSGQVELTASTNTVIAATVKRNPPMPPVLKFRMKVSPSYVGVRKNEPRLLDRINQLIVAKKQNGELNAVYQKWFGQALPEMPLQ